MRRARGRWCIAAIAGAALAAVALGGAGEAHAARRLTLAEAIELALRQAPQLAQSKVGLDRARLAVLRSQLDRVSVRVDATLNELWSKSNILGAQITQCAIAGQDPVSLDANTCAMFGGVSMAAPVQSPENTQGLSNLQARVNVPLFSGFAVEANVAMRQRLQEAAGATLVEARRALVLQVTRDYFRLLRLAMLRDIQDRALARVLEGEKIVGQRVKAGLAPPIDENRARLQRLQRLSRREDLEGLLREATVPLAVALGIDEEIELVDPPLPPPGSPRDIEAPPRPIAELVADARRGRSDLLRDTMRWEAQREAVRIARSGYFPQLGATALLQYGNNQFNIGSGVRGTSAAANPFANMSGSVTLGLTLSINLFDTMNTWSQVRDARFEEARLWWERKGTELAISSDVRAAHARVLHLAMQRKPLVEALAIARDNVAILAGRYKNGEALVIEFLNADVELVDAEQQLADVTAQLRLAWMELDAAIGHVPSGGGRGDDGGAR